LLIHAAQGEIILRADAHSDYAPDYVVACVQALQTTHALNVGGAQQFVAEADFQAGVAIASRSLLGNGGAKYRQPGYSGYADTVYLGCFWRSALIAVGEGKGKRMEDFPEVLEIFDHTQIANQDAELNQQLLRLSDQAIYVSAQIQSWYYPRRTWQSLWQQYFKYGRGRFLTASKHRRNRPLRTKIPALVFLGGGSLLAMDGLLFQFQWHSYGLILLGLLVLFLESARVNWQVQPHLTREIWRGAAKDLPSVGARFYSTALAIAIMPIAYVLGNFYQTYRSRILKVVGW
jgi:succinoglycan biosynthesis protein ExoA